MKLESMFYRAVLAPAWVVLTFFAALFPGGEHFNMVPTYLPGSVISWVPQVRSQSHFISQYLAPGMTSVVLGFILAFGMDRLRVRRLVWKRAVLTITGALAALVIFFFLKNVVQYRSLALAAHKMDFDQPERLVAYPLFCLSTGLLLGSVGAFVYGGIEWAFRANQSAPPNGDPAAPLGKSGGTPGPSSVTDR